MIWPKELDLELKTFRKKKKRKKVMKIEKEKNIIKDALDTFA